MGSISEERPHDVMVPYPAQGHVDPMIKLARLLHSRGFHITFDNTELAGGPHAIDGLRNFRYKTIPDGLRNFRYKTIPDGLDPSQHVPSLCHSFSITCFDPFVKLLRRLQNSDSDGHVPRVTCVVYLWGHNVFPQNC